MADTIVSSLIPGKSIKVGNRPWGVVVDEDNHTAYVIDSDDDAVTPIDTRTLDRGNTINLTNGADYCALNKMTHKLYVLSNDGWVTPIDTSTNIPGIPISVGVAPESLGIDQKNDILYIGGCHDSAIACIDMQSGLPTPISPISLPFAPQSIAVCGSNDTLYVLNEDRNYIYCISTVTGKFLGDPISVGPEPAEKLMLAEESGYLYVLANALVMQVALKNNAVTNNFDSGTRSPGAMAIDEKYQILYITDIDNGAVHSVKLGADFPDAPADMGGLPGGVAVDQESHAVWITSITDNTVTPFRLRVRPMRIWVPVEWDSDGGVRSNEAGESGAVLTTQIRTADGGWFLSFSPFEIPSPGTYVLDALQYTGGYQILLGRIRFTV